MTQSKQSVENTERIGVCDGCGYKLVTAVIKGRRLCRQCMLTDEEPCQLEDHMGGCSALGDYGRMDGAAPRGVLHHTSSFARALDAALKREGWSKDQDQMKAEMWRR